MIPNLFSKNEIPNVIPKELEFAIKEFSKNGDKKEFLEKSFFYVVNSWGGNRINFIFKFGRLFRRDIADLIKLKGYLPCTSMNFLLRVMAVKSGFFDDNDIEIKITHTWYVIPHQYLVVRISDKKSIILDPYNYQFGIDYGRYGRGFHSWKFKPIR